uniref:tRNA-dihydrouridine(47) synthase [NAD(P)(+)] n=1 Tax=Strigamia maritima TaxID=126957 RepID=T1IRL7_STRMM
MDSDLFKERMKSNDGEAKIKPEFVAPSHRPILSEDYTAEKDKRKCENESGNEPKKKRMRGQNKHRPIDSRIPREKKFCPALLSESECKFGDKCCYIHDVAKYIEEKPSDVGEECYLFKTYGKCPFSVTCRFAGQHLTSTHTNIINDELWANWKEKGNNFTNVLTKDLQFSLRKKGYDFSLANNTVKKVQKSMASNVKIEETNCEVDNHSGAVTDEGFIKLGPREIKKVNFNNQLYLAPLTTVGNLPFRRICKGFGADITCSEMALSLNLLQGQQSEWALVKRHECESIFGVQLSGAHADVLSRCGQLMDENCSIDFLDINVGCPIDLVYQKGAGCALMNRTRKFEEIVRSLKSFLKVPLTVKIRTGVHENKNTAHTLIPKLRDWGVNLISMHGRSREARYTKFADWDYINECAQLAQPIPLFGNGDVLSFEEYNYRLKDSSVDGIMIARGALVKPWLFTEIKEQRHWDISSSERLDILRNYVNFGLEHWGADTEGVEKTRRFLLEWLSFLHRYIPVGILERLPQRINERPPFYMGRDDLETLMASANCADWIKISELLLGPVSANFSFLPKHKANSFK